MWRDNGATLVFSRLLHRDHLDSVRAITDSAGAVVERAVYKPFGEQTEWLSASQPAPETKGWIGERFDADAGLQYLNARYYDPVLGMFIQPDWFDVMQPGVGTNRFSYSFNDPINLADQNGNFVPLLVAAAVALVGSYEYANAPTLDSGGHSRSAVDMGSTMIGGAAAGRAAYAGATWASREAGLFIGSRLPSSTIFGLELGTAEATGMGVGVGLAAKGGTIAANAANGLRRETEALAEMTGQFPNASIQGQQYLRYADGTIAKDPLTQTGRRLDFVAVENGTAQQVREVTSMTAEKGRQLRREANILNSGGHYVRDRLTGQLVDVSSYLPSYLDRRP